LEARFELDTWLGNDDGNFAPFAIDFSKSAIKQVLEGTVLHAELPTSGEKRWMWDEIDLEEFMSR